MDPVSTPLPPQGCTASMRDAHRVGAQAWEVAACLLLGELPVKVIARHRSLSHQSYDRWCHHMMGWLLCGRSMPLLAPPACRGSIHVTVCAVRACCGHAPHI